MKADQVFYVGQKVIIEKDGKVLVLHNNFIGADLPGGKIQVGEFNFEKSLIREVKEETGLTIAVGDPLLTGYFTYHPDIIKSGRKKSDYIYIIIYTVTDFTGELSLSHEHEKYHWVSKDEYEKIDDRNGLITRALQKFFN